MWFLSTERYDTTVAGERSGLASRATSHFSDHSFSVTDWASTFATSALRADRRSAGGTNRPRAICPRVMSRAARASVRVSNMPREWVRPS